MSEATTLKRHLEKSDYFKYLKNQEDLRRLIDEEIPSLMVVDGLVGNGEYAVLPLYDVIDYWNSKGQGYGLSWERMYELEDKFMVAWRIRHHSALGIRQMKYGDKIQPCIYVKTPRRRKEKMDRANS